MLLNKDQILGAGDLPFEEVEVPEWGGMVRIRTMTGRDREKFENLVYEPDGEKVKVNREDFRAKLLSACIVGEDGKPMFDEKDIAALSGKSAKALNRLFTVAQDLNGMSQRVQEEIEKK
jgi:hypothetical protein